MTPPEFFGRTASTWARSRLPRLALADLSAHAHSLGERHVDEEPAGHRDLRGDARALGRDGFLGDLDDQVLAALEDVLDGRRFRAAPASAATTASATGARRTAVAVGVFVVVLIIVVVVIIVRLIFWKDEIGRVQERAFFRAYVDERCLNSRKDRLYSSEVDVADHAARLGTIDQKLNELVVLDDRDPRFSRVRVDQNFSFHRCPTRGRLPATRQEGCGGNPGDVVRAVSGERRRQHAKGMSEASG